MRNAPSGVRLHIGLYGRRNVGKSSLLNAIIGQDVSIVSDVPGTTTDVVAKAMELKPLGPVLFLDTAGMDDVGELGEKRIERSVRAMDRTDIALLLTDNGIGEFETRLLSELAERKIPRVVIFSKSDLSEPSDEARERALELADAVVAASVVTGAGVAETRDALIRHAPADFINSTGVLPDLVGPGDVVVLVVPIDLEAPKGRLILPQVQVIREVLDCDARAIVVKERELADTLDMLKVPPRLVVTDSQAILKVAADVPLSVPVTGFSVLFARWKGDLETFVRGTLAIDTLQPGDRVLVAEACTHHPIGDDIGRVKIPRWLRQYVGGDLEFSHVHGHDFPEELTDYQLIIMCGSCMQNRREVLTRLNRCRQANVPAANYGLVIAFSLGVFARMLSPFPRLQEVIDRRAAKSN
ncbi:MAG: [FeFe] hydrogenase H-cluster maturation GTPase HydF [Planctomycetota bacterium]